MGLAWARCAEEVVTGHGRNNGVMMRASLVAIWSCQGKWWCGNVMVMGWVADGYDLG